MTDYASLKHQIDELGIQFVDFRVADFVGRFRHLAIPVSRFTPALLAEGLGFDGSNFGYRTVAGSDMVLIPDLSSAYVEERQGEKVLTIIADIRDAGTRGPAAIDPRGIAQAAVAYAKELGIADDLVVSPEFEFYLFNDVFYDTENGLSSVEIHPAEGCEHRAGMGDAMHSAYHAPLHKDPYFEFRCDVVRQIEQAGIPVKYHHHEVGTFGQHEIELGFDSSANVSRNSSVVYNRLVNAVIDHGGHNGIGGDRLQQRIDRPRNDIQKILTRTGGLVFDIAEELLNVPYPISQLELRVYYIVVHPPFAGYAVAASQAISVPDRIQSLTGITL